MICNNINKRPFAVAFPKEDKARQAPNKKSENTLDLKTYSLLEKILRRPPFPYEVDFAQLNPNVFFAARKKAEEVARIIYPNEKSADKIDDLFRAYAILVIKKNDFCDSSQKNFFKTYYIPEREYKLPFSMICKTDATKSALYPYFVIEPDSGEDSRKVFSVLDNRLVTIHDFHVLNLLSYERHPYSSEINNALNNRKLFILAKNKAVRVAKMMYGNDAKIEQISDIFRGIISLSVRRMEWRDLARQNPDGAIYIKKKVYQLPFSMMIRPMSGGGMRAYLFNKEDRLGSGITKTVYKGIDLINEKFVAIGDFTEVLESLKDVHDMQSLESLRLKYQWQEEINEALALCFHRDNKLKKLRGKIVMPLASEGTLEEFKVKLKDLSTAEKQQLFKEILESVNEIHKLGVVIADINPSNFLVDKGNKIRMCDFSHAFKEGDVDKMHKNTAPAYAAPEQRVKEAAPARNSSLGGLFGSAGNMEALLNYSAPTGVTTKTDVYQVALVLWEMFVDPVTKDIESCDFTSDQAYDSDDYVTLWKMKFDHYPKGSLQRVLLEMLEFDADRRPTIDDVIKRGLKISDIHICGKSCDKSHKIVGSTFTQKFC